MVFPNTSKVVQHFQNLYLLMSVSRDMRLNDFFLFLGILARALAFCNAVWPSAGDGFMDIRLEGGGVHQCNFQMVIPTKGGSARASDLPCEGPLAHLWQIGVCFLQLSFFRSPNMAGSFFSSQSRPRRHFWRHGCVI